MPEQSASISPLKPIRVRCPLGGLAPCVDDLCHGSDTTMCGLTYGYDFCAHDYYPDTCPECLAEGDYEDHEDWEAQA